MPVVKQSLIAAKGPAFALEEGLSLSSTGHRSAKALDDRDQLIGLVALLASEADEFARTSDHRAALRGAAYAHAEPTAELQETFLTQCTKCTQDGIGVDSHDRREIAGGRQALPGLGLAFGDRAPYLCGDLVVQGCRVRTVDTLEHCASYGSIMLINVKEADAFRQWPPRRSRLVPNGSSRRPASAPANGDAAPGCSRSNVPGMAAAERIEVADAPDRDRYELSIDGEVAGFAAYRKRPDLIVFVHTEVDERLQGRGLADRLIRFALEDARTRGLAVLPFCPFVKAFIERHREFETLVPDTRREQFGL